MAGLLSGTLALEDGNNGGTSALTVTVNPGVTPVRSEDLDTPFEQTVRGFNRVRVCEPQALIRPSIEENVIPGGPRGLGIPSDTAALEQLCREVAGPCPTSATDPNAPGRSRTRRREHRTAPAMAVRLFSTESAFFSHDLGKW